MGKLRDEMLATATKEPWLLAVDPLSGAKRSLQSHLKGTVYRLPPPYAKTAPGVLEKGILEAVKGVLSKRRVWHRRIDQSGKIVGSGDSRTIVPGSHTGLPDILACSKGQLLALEVKRPGGTVSAVQMQVLRELQDAGASVAVVVSAERLAAWLDGEGATAKLEGISVL